METKKFDVKDVIKYINDYAVNDHENDNICNYKCNINFEVLIIKR